MTEPKISALLGSQYHYNDKAGRFLPAKFERLAEIVSDYDNDLDLVLIKSQIPPDPQFAVIHWVGNDEYFVVSWWHEHELDDRVLLSLFENDFQKHNPDQIFDKMVARQIAQKLLEEKQHQDEIAEAWEFGKWALQTRLNTFKHNGKVWRE